MPSLRELQTLIAQGILGDAAPAAAYVQAAALTGERRLQVHRNHFFLSVTNALRTMYPAVAKLLGEAGFSDLAKVFIQRTPPQKARISDYGSDFPAFLADCDEAAERPYLTDLARLEWARQEAFHAPEADPLDLVALQRVPPSQHAELRLALHPSCRLIKTAHPVLAIWEASLGDEAALAPGEPTSGDLTVLVARPQGEVVMVALAPAAAELLTAVSNGDRLEQACRRALAVEPGAHLAELLLGLVTDGFICAMTQGAS